MHQVPHSMSSKQYNTEILLLKKCEAGQALLLLKKVQNRRKRNTDYFNFRSTAVQVALCTIVKQQLYGTIIE